MAIDAALIAVGGNLAGDMMMQSGQNAINTDNVQLALHQDQFNARQAAISRMYNAQQGIINRRWETRMADTQMQRRVADLRAAHLNPALAYTQGGASAPMASAPSAGMASAGPLPQLTNPNLGFGQLGSQVASAEQLRSTVNLQDAQANKLNVESGTEIPASVEYIKSQTALNDVQAQNAYKNLQILETQLEPLDSSDTSMAAILQKARVSIAQMSAQEQQQTLQLAIKARNSENAADAMHAKNIYNASDGVWGKLMSYFELGQPAASSAQSLGVTAGDIAGTVLK